MSHAHSHDNTVPPPALFAAAALVVVSLAMTSAVRLGWLPREAVPQAERAKAAVAPLQRRSLAFTDRGDGAVVVTDAASGAQVSVIGQETKAGGFVRGVLRGLARDRKMRGVGEAPPFTLTLWGDGSLSLVDSATGRSVELGAFGPDNRTIFAGFLPDGGAR